MKILLTNDDGIHAPGLWAAARVLRQIGPVFVVAPDREQSGVGTSLTLHAPVRARRVAVDPELSGGNGAGHPVEVHAVEGTPADSCILALEQLVGTVDLVVSGINAGSNLGWDVMVSGTVGAAVQGYVRGYPTIAISVGAVENPQFDAAARLLRLLAGRLLPPGAPEPDHALPADNIFLNINVPSQPLERIAGVRITTLGSRSYGETIRTEGNGARQRYWINRNRLMATNPEQGTDLWALRNNFASITPLQATLGHREHVPAVEALLEGIAAQLQVRDD
jgi:5'-nucleotidase